MDLYSCGHKVKWSGVFLNPGCISPQVHLPLNHNIGLLLLFRQRLCLKNYSVIVLMLDLRYLPDIIDVETHN